MNYHINSHNEPEQTNGTAKNLDDQNFHEQGRISSISKGSARS